MREYGGSTADFTFDGDVTVPNVRLAVATDNDPATRLTTGIYDMAGTAVTEVLSDGLGEIRFQGDDSLPLDLYLTTIDGAGNLGTVWYVIRAADLGALVKQAVTDAQNAAATAETAATSAQTAAASVPADTAARLAQLEADVAALQADMVKAIKSPNGTVTALEMGTKAENDARTGLPVTHLLADRG